MIIRRTPKTGLRFHHQIEPLEARIAPATFTVLNTLDSGAGSLRQAIINANGTANVAVPDVINFNLGTGPFQIQPLTQLPDITEAVIIDGYSQSGASANTLPTGSTVGTNANIIVELSGELLASGNGLVLAGANGGSTVKGLAIHSFGDGVNESGYGIIIKSNNNRIEGNFIGTDATGVATLATENKNAGVRVGALGQTTPLYTGNVIGGTIPATRNLLTGNAYGVQLDEQSVGTQILRNLIGLDKAGNAAYGNVLAGISDFGANNTSIGDNTANGRNIISGSGGPGIAVAVGAAVQIRGNYIGTNVAGTTMLGNTGAGIRITNDASGGLIEGNVISANVGGGIQLGSSVGDGGALNFNVRANFIGTDALGNSPLANDGPGVAFFQGASGHTIGGTGAGQSNTIGFNKGAGIENLGGGNNNRIYRNSIHSNGGLGINLPGPNEDSFGVTPNDSPDTDGVTNWPLIETFNNTGSALTLTGSLNALTNATYRVEFFAGARSHIDLSGYGEGFSYVGFQDVTTNGSGAGTFNFNMGISLPTNWVFSATATPVNGGSTSEFGPTIGATANYTWTGATNSDWFTPGNWSPAVVPSPLDNVTFASGTISLTGPAAVVNFTQTGGTLAGTGELTARGALTWSGGTHTGGTLRLATSGTGTIGTGGAALTWSGGVLENFGALTVDGLGVDFNQGSLVNGATTAVVTLNARLTDSDGAGTVATVSNGGTIVKMGSGSFGFGGINVSNSETIRAVAGTLVVGGITQSSGVLELAGGGIFSTGPISLNGGELVGAGTITGNVSNSGGTVFVGPKGAAGTLNIAGNYSQGSTGFLKVDLGGTTPGTQHDRLNVSGNTGLDGALEHELLGTFVVRVGDSFSVLSSGTLGGTFNSTIGSPPIPTVYAGGLVSLTAVGFNVTNTNDSGAGSLRQAILDANAQPGLDYISFNIPGGGLKTIAPLTVLPSIGGDTVIDAFSQPGSVLNTLAVGSNAAPLIELNGVNVPGTGGFESGLVAASGNVTISGFILNRWADYGIMVTTPTSGSTITGNWIGTDSTGNSAPTNTQTGIFIENAPNISIGSSLPRARNVISGNNGYGVHVSGSSSTFVFIQGNYIGTNPAGSGALGNGLDGVRIESGSNFVGGSGEGQGNVISGNAKAGIVIIGPLATGNSIQGNLIGTDVSGMVAVPNNDRGIKLVFSSATTIGGSFHGAGNVISGNLAGAFQGEGILVDASTNNFIQGNLIGTNKEGTASIGLQSYGIELANASTGNRVGGPSNSGGNQGNVISGNLSGGIIISGNSDGAIIEGNRIGTDAFGVGALANGGAGVAIIVSNNCIIGGMPETGNTIAFNAGPGVQVIDASASGNTVRNNSIYSNTGLGIDLGTSGVTANDALDADSGANGLLNFPTLSTYTAGLTPTVTGTYSGLANQTFTLDFYASNTADPSGNGEGRYYLGAFMVTTNGSGTASFTAPLNGFIPAGGVISATATQSSTFNTSEFSGIVSTATTRTWDAGGGANTDWFNAVNWSGDVVPGAGDIAILNTNATITLSGNASVVTFTQSTGTLTGTGTLTVVNDFGWSGGTQSGTGTTKIPVGALWNLTSNTGNMVLDGRTVNLDGTANFTGTGIAFMNNGATINNAGTFIFATEADIISTNGTSNFNNLSGAFLRQTGGGNGSVIGDSGPAAVLFNNAGTVEAIGQEFVFDDGGTDTDATYIATSTGTINFRNGARTFNGDTSFQGGGLIVAFNGATWTVNNNATISGSNTRLQFQATATLTVTTSLDVQAGSFLSVSGGTVNGAGSLNVTGELRWDDGIITGSGQTNILSGGTLQFASATDKTLDGRTLDVAGSTSLSNGRLLLNNGAIFNNSGVLQVFGDLDINSTAGAGAFNNLTGAVFRKVSGTGVTEVGSPAGGDVAFSNVGTVEVQSGTLQFTDAFTQSAGTTIFSGGGFASAVGMTFAGGVVTGSGVFTGDITNTGATVRPGGAGVAGAIAITGNFTQGTSGTLSAELGGAGGGQSDALTVGGTATLGGLLEVSFINGYAPVVGDTLNVVTAGSRNGTFSNTQGTSLLTVGYTATQAQLVRNAASLSWDGGGGNTDWFNPMNWNPDFVPTAGDNAFLTINSVINLPSNVSVASYTQTMGSLGGVGDLTVTGSFVWNGGQLDSGGGKLILPSGSVSGLSTGPWDLRRSVVQGGSFSVSDGADLSFAGGLLFENSGTVVFAGTNFTIEARNAGGGTFRNLAGGILTINAPGEEMLGGTFENNGTVNLSANTAFKTTNGTSSGTWNLGAGSTFIFDHSGLATTLSGASFGGAGAVVVQGSSSLTFPVGAATMFNTVSFTQTNGALNGPGAFLMGGVVSLNTVAFTNGIAATLLPTSTLTNVNGGLSGGSSLDTAGTSSFSGGFTFADGSVLTNAGTLTVPNGAITDFIISSGGGSIVNDSGAMFVKLPSGNNTAIQVPFANSGMVSVSGQMSFTTFTQTTSGAALVLNGGVISGDVVLNDGAFSGVGSHAGGSVTNIGAVVRPGGLDARGTLHVNGYEQQSGGTLEIEIASASDFDVLDLTGATTLGGGLSIDTVAPFIPATGNTFRVVTTAALPSGNFATFTGDVTRLTRSVDGSGVLLTAATLTYVWDNSSTDGDWFNPLNWDLDSGTPGAADAAVVNIPTSITLSTSVTVSAYMQSLGTINGPGQLTITDALTWSGGIIGVDAITGATSVNALGGATAPTLNNALLDLGGTTTLGGSVGVDLAGNGTAELRNNGAFAFTGSAGITGTGSFHNFGGSSGVTKTGPDQAILDVAFLNGAALNILDGVFTLNGGGSWLSDLTVSISANAVLDIIGGAHSLQGGTAFVGAGATHLHAGSFIVNGDEAHIGLGHTFDHLGGTLGGTADLIVDGALIWSGGEQVGPGETIVSAGGVAHISSSDAKALDLRVLRVAQGGILNIDGDGPVNMANGSSIVIGGAMNIGTAAAFNDAGGAPSSINILTDGNFDKSDNGTSTIGVPFVTDGSLHFNNGVVNFQGTFTQMGGSTALNGGGVGFATAAEFQGGTLRGIGTLTGSINNSGATVSPGISPINSLAEIVISGDYIQGSGGILEIEIEGLSIVSYDQLRVGGNASLGGTVSVFLPGFTPARGDTFRIISAGSVSGTFATLDLPPLFEADYTAISVDLSLPFLAPGVIRLGELDGTNGFKIPSALPSELLGSGVAVLGDINGDGFRDFAVSGIEASATAGNTYVVFGKASGFSFNINALNGTDGFTIIGEASGDLSGQFVRDTGDINGDGISDLILTAPGNDATGPNSGAAYIIFGRSTGFSPTISLSLLTAADGFKLIGLGSEDDGEISASGAGDVNNDGTADLIIGVWNRNVVGPRSGAAYVVFGSSLSQFPLSVDVNTLVGTNGFSIAGLDPGDHFGFSVAGAGDLNADGVSDIIIGAPSVDTAASIDAGVAYVFFGRKDGVFSATLDPAMLDGKTGFKLEGLEPFEGLGASVAAIGDMNGDDIDDVIIGTFGNTDNSGSPVPKSSSAYVIFGKAKGHTATLDLSTLNGTNGFRLLTAETISHNGISVSAAGDFNGDGFADVVIGAPDSDTAYLMYGRATGYLPTLDLETLNGTNGIRLLGDAGTFAGISVSGGDVNGDGAADLIIGAPNNGGAAYLIFGNPEARDIPVSGSKGTTLKLDDVDGDVITITVKGGKITADMLTFGADGGLQMVDLTEGEYKDGSSITFSVKKKVGDGIFNVGAINAPGIKLGKVSVTGDLGHIDAGNGDPLKNAIKFLNVGSLGAMGGSTQIPGTDDPLVSNIRGALPKVMVKGNFTNATLNVLGKLGSITVGGSFTGTGAFSSSQLAGLAALGHGQLGHVSGGTTLASSGLTAGSIGKLTVKGGLTNSAISSSSSISSATINGDFTRSALVAATTTGAVKVLGKLIGDATTPSVISARGPLSPTSQAKSVAISSLTIKGNVSNAEILIGYDRTFAPINGDASIGNVTINGNWTASSLVAGIKDDTDNGFGLDDVPIPGFDATPTVFSRIASLIIKGTIESSPSATDRYAITAQQIGKVKINGTSIVLDKLLPDNVLIAPTDDLRLVEVF